MKMTCSNVHEMAGKQNCFSKPSHPHACFICHTPTAVWIRRIFLNVLLFDDIRANFLFENRWEGSGPMPWGPCPSQCRCHILLRPLESGAEALARISGFPREIHSSVRPALCFCFCFETRDVCQGSRGSSQLIREQGCLGGGCDVINTRPTWRTLRGPRGAIRQWCC